MKLTYEVLSRLADEHGDSFYLLDLQHFSNNYRDMLMAFQDYYDNTRVAYSYKTNYLPVICKTVDALGGYAEIVSEMEMELALQLGVNPEKIFYNGPYKKKKYVEKLLFLGGVVNIDSEEEANMIEEIAQTHIDKFLRVGVRVNLYIGQENVSRFGMEVEQTQRVICSLKKYPNIRIVELHSHLPFRSPETFEKRMVEMEMIISQLGEDWEYISFGGGYLGNITKELSSQLGVPVVEYADYAKIIAKQMQAIFGNKERKPKLIIEPGSALVADTMKYVVKVISIKKIRNKYIATTSGSSYNMNPSVKNVKRPMTIFCENGRETKHYVDLDMAGYTCIEGDYLCREYNGDLHENAYVMFGNVGSYSIVMKPPFILPDVPILEVSGIERTTVVAKAQNMCEIFSRYIVDGDQR